MDIKGLDKIYIIHYEPLKERRDYLEKRLKELEIDNHAQWIISTKESEEPSETDLKIRDTSEKAMQERRKILGDKIPPIGRIDTIMMLQHIKLLRKISKKKNKKISMVFEDDVLLEDNFTENLLKTIEKLEKMKWDVVYTDKGSLFVEPEIEGGNKEIFLYKPPNKRANTTGSYLVTGRSCKKILKLMKKFTLGPDMEMSYIQKKHNLNVYWTIPFLTKQGSIEQIYQSNVRGGSLTGIFLIAIRKVERISPSFARYLAKTSDRLRSIAERSKLLILIKRIIKSIIKYDIK